MAEKGDGSTTATNTVCAKLTNFGSARELPPSGKRTVTMAATSATTSDSLRYTAPEMFLNGECGIESDIFSWGLVSYEILSQAKPFGAITEFTSDLYRIAVCQQELRPEDARAVLRVKRDAQQHRDDRDDTNAVIDATV